MRAGDVRLTGRAGWRTAADLLPALGPLLFVPLLAGIVVTLVELIGIGSPRLPAPAVHMDASALYLGSPIYQDPAAGYTGFLYTPLFPALVSLLYRVHFWAGWAPLLSIAATLSLVGLAGTLAYAPRSGRRDRMLAAIEAAGVGALCWWLVSNIQLNFLYDGRHDHVAWAFALLGLVLVPAGLDSSRKALVASVALLTLGFWSKQPTLVVSVGAALWVVGGAALRTVDRRRAAVFLGSLLAVNLAVLATLNILTDGWEWFFNFELQTYHAYIYHGLFLDDLRRDATFAVLFAGGVWAAVGARRGLPRAARAWFGSRDAQIATILAVFAVVALAAATYVRRKQGSADNQYIGLIWGLGLLGAVGYRVARRERGTRAIVGGLVLACFMLALVAHAVGGHPKRPLPTTKAWIEVSPDLRAYARDHLIYDTEHTYLTVQPQRVIYPEEFSMIDLLAAGRQPRYLLQALLDRRFDAVRSFRERNPQIRSYTWAYGKWEENYLWKLNRVIDVRYAPAPGLPEGLLARRPGPDPAPWMRHCFAPFRLGGASFRIRGGGGFWCTRPGRPGELTLVDTPAPATEVITKRPVRSVDGGFTMALVPGPGRADLGAWVGSKPAWSIALERRAPEGPVKLLLVTPGTAPRTIPLEPRLVGSQGAVRGTLSGTLERGLRLVVNGRPIALPAVDGEAVLRLSATRGSGARFDLGRLRIR